MPDQAPEKKALLNKLKARKESWFAQREEELEKGEEASSSVPHQGPYSTLQRRPAGASEFAHVKSKVGVSKHTGKIADLKRLAEQLKSKRDSKQAGKDGLGNVMRPAPVDFSHVTSKVSSKRQSEQKMSQQEMRELQQLCDELRAEKDRMRSELTIPASLAAPGPSSAAASSGSTGRLPPGAPPGDAEDVELEQAIAASLLLQEELKAASLSELEAAERQSRTLECERAGASPAALGEAGPGTGLPTPSTRHAARVPGYEDAPAVNRAARVPGYEDAPAVNRAAEESTRGTRSPAGASTQSSASRQPARDPADASPHGRAPRGAPAARDRAASPPLSVRLPEVVYDEELVMRRALEEVEALKQKRGGAGATGGLGPARGIAARTQNVPRTVDAPPGGVLAAASNPHAGSRFCDSLDDDLDAELAEMNDFLMAVDLQGGLDSP